ncbi:MAG: divergent polysaccharide deacetylase family protein, partial [Pseudomonadota bacterium]
MIRGILLGSVSGAALSGLLLISVSLLAPPPFSQVAVRAPDGPAGLVAPTPETGAVARPDPLPERAAAPVATPQETSEPETLAPADGIVIPAGSQFGQPRQDVAIVTPERDAQPRRAVAAVPEATVTPPAAPVADTRSVEGPGPTSVTALTAPPADGAAPDLPAPVVESAPQTFRAVDNVEEPPLPDNGGGEVVVATEPAEAPAPVEPEVAEAEPAEADTLAPVAEVADDPPELELAEIAPAPFLAEEAEVPDAPAPPLEIVEVEVDEIADDVAPEAAAEPEGEETAQAPAPSSEDGGLRTTIRAVDPEDVIVPEPDPEAEVAEAAQEAPDPVLPRRIVLDSERAADEDAAPVPDAAVVPSPAGALDAFAAASDRRAGMPAFAIVLIDDPASGLDRDTLSSFEFPVAFAIDPSAADAEAAMEAYRAAGHEVLLLADALAPEGAPQEIEVALGGARAAVPEAVAVLDRADGGFADRPDALGALLPSLGEGGLGLVTYPGGLGSGVATALRSAVPAAQLYRVLDEDGERAPVIERFLDRATFEAAQNGAAIVVGRTSAETVSAIYS